MTFLLLMPNEQECTVQVILSGNKNALKIMEMIGKYLAIIFESTTYCSLNK
jgi:hypothetical protein